MLTTDIKNIISELSKEKVVSIPTDTVYGLSCLINITSVESIINLKNRDSSKGFIIISHDYEHLLKYIDTLKLTKQQIDKIKIPALSPTTWIVPVKKKFMWLTGGKPTVAVRLVKTNIIRQICSTFDNAIVSTSANISGKNFVNDLAFINKTFENITILDTPSTQAQPSNIINLVTGEKIR